METSVVGKPRPASELYFNWIKNEIAKGKKSSLLDITHGDLNTLSIERIVEAAGCDDAIAKAGLDMIGINLGIGIASLVNALNPDLVVFGGSISIAWEFLHPIIEDQLRLRALRWHRDATRIVPARHGADACVMGGIAAVYHQILAKPSDRPSAISLPVFVT